MPDFLLPFGPFHMVILHLPIGALTAIWFLEILLENKSDKHKNQAIGLLHLLLLLTCGLTILLGLSYEAFGQYGDEIETHELWGYIFGACVLVTYFLYWIHRKVGKLGSKFCYLLSLMAATVAMVITGHQGGELIHGKGFLTKPFKEEPAQITPAPAPIPASAPAVDTALSPQAVPTKSPPQKLPQVVAPTLPAPIAETDTMARETEMEPMAPMMDTMAAEIAPPPPARTEPKIALFEATQAIFQRNCYKCHGATKQKGDYRLDNKHSIYTGGKSKLTAIVPGKVHESELMHRMQLPRTHDDVMPPESKEPVPAEDIETVRQWIAAGAYWPDESELNTASREYVKVGDLDTDQLIEQISQTGVKAEYNAWGDESVRIDLGVVTPGELDQAIAALSSFREKLTWLDCSQLELPESFIQQLANFQNLERLHLDGSNVTDSQLTYLSQLPKLSYLNLYNTRISDQGLTALHNCTNLKKLFLSQTAATRAGITQLKSHLPELEVIYR